jgi:hypothetical protein
MVDVRTNLLKNRHTLTEKEYQQERNYLRWSVVGLISVVVVVVAISLWNLVLTRQLASIEQAMTTTSKEMQGLVQASAQQVYLKSRLQLVTGFLSNRSVSRESLQKIFTTAISGSHISAVSFEGDTVLGVQYESDSSTALAELLNYYEFDNGYFTQAVSRGITRSKDGGYQLSLALTLPKEGK